MKNVLLKEMRHEKPSPLTKNQGCRPRSSPLPPVHFRQSRKKHRSSHVGHGLATFGKDKIIDFYANYACNRCGGHSAFGWMEYRTSLDGGKTRSEPVSVSPYAGRIYDAIYHEGAIYVLEFCHAANGTSLEGSPIISTAFLRARMRAPRLSKTGPPASTPTI